MPQSKKIDLSDCCDVEFWRQLCPNLNVGQSTALTASPRLESCNIREADWRQCKELIGEDGYFVYEDWFDPTTIEPLADCFRRLASAQLLPAFCFVYDEFWELMLGLSPLLSDLLGEYLYLPAVWAWHVHEDSQTAFAPHRDQIREVATDDEDHLDYLTIWIPLTDLNHLNSCISVLPASLDPDYDAGTDSIRVEDLQHVRSLQAARGSVMGWATGLAHWGSTPSKFGGSRMSIGLYVQKPDAECLDPPPLDLTKPLPLRDRLRLIGHQIVNYSRDDAQLEIARHLLEAN